VRDTSSELLRFATAGSVDDGKSTLIGRLLYDTKAIFEDQLEQVARASERRHGAANGTNGNGSSVDLSLLTDGLRAEREQGITIDVAYRYFTTPRRSFIIADTPGHVRYTRNMVTGASTADLALVLVDARNGVVEQSRRHAFIASLLRIPHLVICVNKMTSSTGTRRRSTRSSTSSPTSPRGSRSPTSRSSRSARCRATTSSSAPSGCRGTTGRRCSTTSSTCTSRRTATSSTRGSPCSG
jgi:GTPase